MLRAERLPRLPTPLSRPLRHSTSRIRNFSSSYPHGCPTPTVELRCFLMAKRPSRRTKSSQNSGSGMHSEPLELQNSFRTGHGRLRPSSVLLRLNPIVVSGPNVNRSLQKQYPISGNDWDMHRHHWRKLSAVGAKTTHHFRASTGREGLILSRCCATAFGVSGLPRCRNIRVPCNLLTPIKARNRSL